jgi:hypothetical protein
MATAKKTGTGTATRYEYSPAMCERMIELGKMGKSQKAIWSELGISAGAADRFKRDYPEFADALDLSRVHSQAYYENLMLENLENKNFNSRLVEIALRGQHAGDYRDDKNQKVDLKAEVKVDFGSAVTDLLAQLKKAG